MSTEVQARIEGICRRMDHERKGTGVPGFLKLAFPIIGAAVVIYLAVFTNGEIHHSTRGPLVQQLNAVTGTANGFMYVWEL